MTEKKVVFYFCWCLNLYTKKKKNMEVDESFNNDENVPLSQYSRTSDDIKSMIKLAKLNEKQLTDVTQVLYYGDVESNPDLKLLELNGSLLSAIEEGQTLSFKGGLNEKVVLCTNDQTFEVKEAGISNSLLLIPELKLAQSTSKSPLKSPKNRANSSMERNQNESTGSIDDDELFDPTAERQQERRIVKKVFHEYFECREVKPKFRKLGELLQLTRYSGPENEYCIDRSLLFTFNQLLNTTQCSRREFENGLKKFRAFEFEGRMRVFDIEYEYRLLSLLLGIITENSWPIDGIDRDETLSAISETIAPAPMLQAMFDMYTFPSQQSSSSRCLYTYREEMVCRTIAQNVLQQGTKFHYNDFMDTWQNALPDGFQVQEKYLRGIGIVDRSVANVPCVRTLIEQNLTTSLIDRLRVLFKTRERWTLDEIEPYIEFFANPQLSITSILAKHARAITEKGQRIYVSKHGV